MALDFDLEKQTDILDRCFSGQFKRIRDFSVDPNNRLWFVSDFSEFGSTGHIVRVNDSLEIEELPSDHEFNELEEPHSIFIRNNDIYIGDFGKKTIFVYDRHTCKKKKLSDEQNEFLSNQRLFPESIVVLEKGVYFLNQAFTGDDSWSLCCTKDNLSIEELIKKFVYDIAYHKDTITDKEALYILQRENGKNTIPKSHYTIKELVNGHTKRKIHEEHYQHLNVDKYGRIFLYKEDMETSNFRRTGHKILVFSEEFDIPVEKNLDLPLQEVDKIRFDNEDRLIVAGPSPGNNTFGYGHYMINRYKLVEN